MVRRLILALTVVAVMAGALIGPPSLTPGGFELSTKVAAAQPGAPNYCGDYQTAYYVSSGGYVVRLGVEMVPQPLDSGRLVCRLGQLVLG